MSESRLGLRALIAAAKPEECPFCGEPKQKRETRPVPKIERKPNEHGLLNVTNTAPLPHGKRGRGGRPAFGAPKGYNLTCGDPECAVVAYTRYWKRDANARNREKRLHLSVASGTPSP